MKRAIDILGLGCVSVDDLAVISRYPEPDGKVAIDNFSRQCGGLTGTALVAAARLGAKCAYAGALAHEELSECVLKNFTNEGIDTQFVQRRPEARPVYAFIAIDQQRQTRNIFFNKNTALGPTPGWPQSEVICSAGALLVDYFGVEGMICAARTARSAGVPVIADFEEDPGGHFPELLHLVDHLLLPLQFARQITGFNDPSAITSALWHDQRQVVVLTAGIRGCWFISAESPSTLQHQTAFCVNSIDTTGCGDVFHGAYAYGLVRGLDVANRIRFAAATAALKTLQTGGQSGIPTAEVVETFLRNSTNGF